MGEAAFCKTNHTHQTSIPSCPAHFRTYSTVVVVTLCRQVRYYEQPWAPGDTIVDLLHSVCTLESMLCTGRKLLYRDKKLKVRTACCPCTVTVTECSTPQLHLYDLESGCRVTLLSYCSYVQWVASRGVTKDLVCWCAGYQE